jgi:uncharacterized membrane protein YciS (DUF1049 family)
MPHFVENVLMGWQYQPVHNVFLLIWAEIGIIGLGLFLGWLWSIFYFKVQRKTKNVPRGTFWDSTRKTECFKGQFTESELPLDGKDKCSTWNLYIEQSNDKIISTGSESIKPRQCKDGDTILNNNNIKLSTRIITVYFQGIFLGFLFIMLFDHYFWDIWPGQALFWLTAGVIAGIRKKC